MRHAATCLVMLFAAGCGGQPVGSKVPRPNPTDVAVGAAAAAAALTLANPDAAARKPEGQQEKSLRGVKGPKETVPGAVLDRADSGAKQPCDRDGAASAAAAPSPQPTTPGRLDLVPAPENRERAQPAQSPAPCPNADDDEDRAGD